MRACRSCCRPPCARRTCARARHSWYAALAADGVSEMDEICHIERGYEDIVEKLRGLGADIKRVEKPAGVLRQAAL